MRPEVGFVEKGSGSLYIESQHSDQVNPVLVYIIVESEHSDQSELCTCIYNIRT